MENAEKQDEENESNEIISKIIMIFIFILLILCFVYEFQIYSNFENRTIFHSDFVLNATFVFFIKKDICWIFNEKVKYQLLLSLGSIVMNNPDQRFNFYFILPPNKTIDLTPFNKLIKYGSTIHIRNYEPRHAYLSNHAPLECKWPGIIIVKIWLFEILPESEKVLYLDTDVMNMAPIHQLWNLHLGNKTFAAVTKFEADSYYWLNSGVIFYNLRELRKRNRSLWDCANMDSCFLDDLWHTACHSKDSVYPLPLRYNIEMFYIKKPPFTKLHEEEKNKICLVHLKDTSQVFYTINNISDIPKMEVVGGHPIAIKVMTNLFKIKEKIDQIVHL